MDQNLKNDIEECLVCADEIEAYGIIKDRMTTTFRENVRYEMLKLLAYIGYGNGFFSGQEIDFIKEATGFNVTEGMLRSIVASEHLQESSYKDNPPFAMKYFILSDAGGKAKDNKKILKRENPDLVITYSIKPNIYAGYLCGKMKIPFLANVQGLGTAFQKPVLSDIVTVMYRTALRKVEKTFFENQANAQEFKKRRILSEEKEVVLHGAGINLEEYRYHFYPNNEKIHFLYLGRIMKEKGMDELFGAIERLRKDGCDFVLDLIGFFEEEYRKKVEHLQKEGIVRFYGFQEDPRPFYAQADCVVLPSYHEGMSNVLLEAAASGRAIITTDIPGCREAVDNGKSGMLCRVKSADSLYKAMKRFTELSRDKREAVGKAGRKKMEREFDKKKVVEETVEVITGNRSKQERGRL